MWDCSEEDNTAGKWEILRKSTTNERRILTIKEDVDEEHKGKGVVEQEEEDEEADDEEGEGEEGEEEEE